MCAVKVQEKQGMVAVEGVVHIGLHSVCTVSAMVICPYQADDEPN